MRVIKAEAGAEQAIFTRRASLASVVTLLAVAGKARAADIPPPPKVGDCPECIGEVNDTLNSCTLSSTSCVSTLNDDRDHFVVPWEYEGSREAAVDRLIAVATGGQYEAGLISTPFGISRSDAAAYIAGGVMAVVKGEDLPPQPRRQKSAEVVPFDGVLVDRSVTKAGCDYVRIVFGTAGGTATEVEDPSEVIDAEFIFFPDDNIAVLRAASRAEPARSSGQLGFSFTDALVVDRNTARRQLDSLRQALRWQPVPVITDFDPNFNPEVPLWFERLFQPFDDRNNFTPSGEAYPETRLGLPQ